LEDDLAASATEITSRHIVDRRSLLPLVSAFGMGRRRFQSGMYRRATPSPGFCLASRPHRRNTWLEPTISCSNQSFGSVKRFEADRWLSVESAHSIAAGDLTATQVARASPAFGPRNSSTGSGRQRNRQPKSAAQER